VLTDAQSKVIIDEVMVPAFKQGDYDAGVFNGTLAALHAIGGANLDASPQPVAMDDDNDTDNGGGRQGFHLPILLIVFLVWIVFGRFLWPLFFLGGMGGRGGWGGGGFGGGGFGGGGFSGGGGSFGGGGASGNW
jgi:uncharacterized protein